MADQFTRSRSEAEMQETRELHQIGFESAEQESEDLPHYYFDNDYYRKAVSFSKQNSEFFLIGRTGSGKSAILEMIRQKKPDILRIINITEEDFAVQFLLSSPEVSDIPTQYRQLAFKTLWKYIVIINMLKSLYGSEFKWTNLIYGSNKNAYELLNRFGELSQNQKTFTDQVISFLQQIKEISFSGIGGLKTERGIAKNELYDLFKIIHDFEKKSLFEHLEKKYLYVLIDDLDKNWTASQDNIDLIQCLFDCIIELGTRFYGNVKFIVALRTDIFRQLNFHQTEKVRPYVTEINWYSSQLRRIIELRLTAYWKCSIDRALSRFPKRFRGEDFIEYLIQRTMRRPRDLINFVNLCINEANMKSASYISGESVHAAERRYSRFRVEALLDEWKFVYPQLEEWIDLFAGIRYTINYNDLKSLFDHEARPIKEIIDILYEVGFLGYFSPKTGALNFSFISRGKPGYDHKYRIHMAFYSYLEERADELGRAKFVSKAQDTKDIHLREDMLDLFERLLAEYPDSISIQQLKNEILSLAPEFDVSKLGYPSLEEFLQASTKLVTLYSARGIAYVKPREIGDDIARLSLEKEEQINKKDKRNKSIKNYDEAAKEQLYIGLVKKILLLYPEGQYISQLKHLMLKHNPEFNEKTLGYKKFSLFLRGISDELILFTDEKGYEIAKLSGHEPKLD
jgi:hypothetical protein